jgi:8-oxo-dGTP pyrophosphatase MutT (NUDIX family)
MEIYILMAAKNHDLLKLYIKNKINNINEQSSSDNFDMGKKGEYHLSMGDDDRFWGNRGAGILLICPQTKRVLLVLRSRFVNEPGTWGIPGGAIDNKQESPEAAAKREANEEVGYSGPIEMHDAYVFKAPNSNFTYYNFIGIIDEEFEPTLDWENSDAQWFELDNLPSPLHFGIKALLSNSMSMIERFMNE